MTEELSNTTFDEYSTDTPMSGFEVDIDTIEAERDSETITWANLLFVGGAVMLAHCEGTLEAAPIVAELDISYASAIELVRSTGRAGKLATKGA